MMLRPHSSISTETEADSVDSGMIRDPLLERQGRFYRDARNRNRATFRQSVLRIGDIEGHHGNRPYNIFMDTIIFFVTTIEISVVVYLSYSHFRKEMDLQAVLMLFPLFLSAVGVTYFLSDKIERMELQNALQVKWATDFLQVPILGPVLLAFRVMSIPWGCSNNPNYERIEATAIKMRQASAYFCAAPESLIQLMTLLVNQTDLQSFDMYLEIGAVGLFVVTIAESNTYNLLSDYYKLFRANDPNDWKLDKITIWQKLLLFFHTLFSVGSRIMGSAAVKAAVLYYWKKGFALVLIITIFGEIGYRLVLYYVSRILKYCALKKPIPDSCYESISYAWKQTILNYGFQSENMAVQFLFYLENIASFAAWWFAVQHFAPTWVMNMLLVPMTITFVIVTGFSFIFLLLCNFFRLIMLRGPCMDDTVTETTALLPQ